jgi:hypothetical protein
MRVTKVIREYVEREVGAKFNPLIREVNKEYDAERAELERRLNELKEETEARAIEIASSLGFAYTPWHSDAVRISTNYFSNREKEEANLKLRRELESRRDKTIEDLLLNLELGETTKAELKDAIEAVTV